jgi:hypothetical protein
MDSCAIAQRIRRLCTRSDGRREISRALKKKIRKERGEEENITRIILNPKRHGSALDDPPAHGGMPFREYPADDIKEVLVANVRPKTQTKRMDIITYDSRANTEQLRDVRRVGAVGVEVTTHTSATPCAKVHLLLAQRPEAVPLQKLMTSHTPYESRNK